MSTIGFRESGPERAEEAAAIYRDRDWQSYPGDSEKQIGIALRTA